MRLRLFFAVPAMLVAACWAVAAADITGNWRYEQPGRNGPGPTVTIYLKADGSKLTGKIRLPAGRGGDVPQSTEVDITNGKVDGDKIAFDVVRETPNGVFTTKYEGAVSEGRLRLKIIRPGRSGGEPVATEVTAKSVRCPPEPPSACIK